MDRTPSESPAGPWNVLPYLFPERRFDDPRRGVRRGRHALSNKLLFGPYWRLPAGHYRLSLTCAPAKVPAADRALVGVEVIASNRHQLAWRDFTPGELSQAPFLDFEVRPERGVEHSDTAFEFRFTYLGADGLDLSGVTLARLETDFAPTPRRWRLMAPLKPFLLGHLAAARTGAGVRLQPTGLPLPNLRTRQFILPAGRFELRIAVESSRPIADDRDLLTVRLLVRRGTEFFKRSVKAADVRSGAVVLSFEIGSDVLGADVTYPVILEIFPGRDRVHLRDIELVHLGEASPRAAAPRRSRASRSASRKMVAIGNCQVETLVDAIEKSPHLARRITARHYRPDLPPDLLAAAKHDLANCDIVLIQDIAEFDASPLRSEIPDTAQIIHVPCLHLASLWPFDGYNGPTDFQAFDREHPNLTFVTLDGLLGRLRSDIPDPSARFEAYRRLEVPGIIDVARLHRFEERRLLAMDQRYGFGIGAYILANFRSKRLFHTTAHPGRTLFNMLLRHVTGKIGAPMDTWWWGLDHLRRDQTPVHPLVARRLGVRWATPRTGYMHRGRRLTWEAYVRAYIAHYG